MSFKEHIEQTECKIEQKAKEIIIEFDLSSASRNRSSVYRRAFIYNELRSKEEPMKLEDIGRLFNRDHATVIHGIKTHRDLTALNDKYYRRDTRSIETFFYPIKNIKFKYNLLRRRILSCHNLFEIDILKSLLKKNEL